MDISENDAQHERDPGLSKVGFARNPTLRHSHHVETSSPTSRSATNTGISVPIPNPVMTDFTSLPHKGELPTLITKSEPLLTPRRKGRPKGSKNKSKFPPLAVLRRIDLAQVGTQRPTDDVQAPEYQNEVRPLLRKTIATGADAHSSTIITPKRGRGRSPRKDPSSVSGVKRSVSSIMLSGPETPRMTAAPNHLAHSAILKPWKAATVTVNGARENGTDNHTKTDETATLDAVEVDEKQASGNCQPLEHSKERATGSVTMADAAVRGPTAKRRRISEHPTMHSAGHAEQMVNFSNTQTSMPSTIPDSFPSPSLASTMISRRTPYAQQSVNFIRQEDVSPNHPSSTPTFSMTYAGASQAAPSRQPSQVSGTLTSSETLKNTPYSTQSSQQTLQHESASNSISETDPNRSGMLARAGSPVGARYSTKSKAHTGKHSIVDTTLWHATL